MRFFPTKLVLIATAVCALVIAVIYSGAVSFLADDASVSIHALWSIVTYWALFSLAVFLVAGIIRRPREMALAGFATLLVLALSEVALRVAHVQRAMKPYAGLSSSVFHHVNAPDQTTFMGVYEGHAVIIRTNGDGMRTDYTREEFLGYHDRILVMGDSFVWGMGVRQDHMVTAALERKLRERLGRDDIAVVPGAAISYSPLLLAKRYREVYRRYRPTVALMVLDVSDIGDDYKYEGENVDGDTLRWDFPNEKPARFYLAVHQLARPLLDWVKERLLYPYYTFFRPDILEYNYYDFRVEIDGTVEKNRFFIYRHPLSSTRPYFDATLHNVDRLAGEAAADSADFALVVSPRYNHWSDRESPGNWEVRQYKYGLDDPYEFAYLDYFDAARDTLDYPVFSLYPAFEKTDRFPLVFANDPHWNDNGADFVAGLLCDFLIDHGWVPHK